MKITVAVLDKQKNSAVGRVIETLDRFSLTHKTMNYGLVTPRNIFLDKNLELLEKQCSESSAIVGYISSKPKAASSNNIVQLDDATLFFEGRIYAPPSQTDLAEQIAKNPVHCETALSTLISHADGDYTFLMVKDGWIAAGRDPIGVKPLYFGENSQIAAYATNKAALWFLGIQNPKSFPPGNLGFADNQGFKFKTIRNLSFSRPKPISMENAAKTLLELLNESVKRRVRGLKKVAVAFSGGLDSSILAFLANKLGLMVELVHVSMENEQGIEEAMQAADELNLPLQVHLFKDSDVEKSLPHIVELIEESDPVKASIGVPFYWASQKAAEEGFGSMLAGQGADELFGGYQRYVQEYCQEGVESIRSTMFDNVSNIYASNLERDLKITTFFDVELLLPFANFEIAEFATSLPIECKMEQDPNTLRKLVLRAATINAGLPKSIASKPKKAVQYSTGINDAVKRITKKQGKTVNEYINELFQKSIDAYKV